MGKTTVWLIGNSMLIQLDETTDESTEEPVTSGIAVQAEVYDKNAILLATVVMNHVSGGLWQGISSVDDVDGSIEKGDQIKVLYLIDGGGPTSQAKWTATPEVKERAA